MKNRIFAIFLFCSVIFIFSGCRKSSVIVLDDSDPLALMPDVKWALIVNPYVGFQKEANWDSDVISHARKGEIFQIAGKSVNYQNEVWYKFEEGYLHESVLLVYSNKLKAKRAFQIMEEN